MSKTDFVPKRDGDLDKYEENFVNKLPLYAPVLNMDPALVAELAEEINEHRSSFSGMISKRAASKSATEENLMKKDTAVNSLRRAARIIKSMKNYTAAIGDDLQIIGSETTLTDTTQLKPELIAKVNGQIVKINFRKNGTHGVKMFSKRAEETEFTLLGISTRKPYTDNREKVNPARPEQREYYAVYFIGTDEVGLKSDRVSVTIA